MNKKIFEEYNLKCKELKTCHEYFYKYLSETFPYIQSEESSNIKQDIEKDIKFVWRSITDLKSKKFKIRNIIFSPPYNGLRHPYDYSTIDLKSYEILNNDVYIGERWNDDVKASLKDIRSQSGINIENFDIFYSLLKEAINLFKVEEYKTLTLFTQNIRGYESDFCISIRNFRIEIDTNTYMKTPINSIGESFEDDCKNLNIILEHFNKIEIFLNQSEEEAKMHIKNLKEFSSRLKIVANNQRAYEGLKR
jgi:hypothetical protein